MTIAELFQEEIYSQNGLVRSIPAEWIDDAVIKSNELIVENELMKVQFENGRTQQGFIYAFKHGNNKTEEIVSYSNSLLDCFKRTGRLPAKMGIRALRAIIPFVKEDGKVLPKNRIVGFIAEVM